MSNFHPLDVAGRGSETQLAGENLNYLIQGLPLIQRHLQLFSTPPPPPPPRTS